MPDPVMALPGRSHLISTPSGIANDDAASHAQRKEAPERPREASSPVLSSPLAPTSSAPRDESPPMTARGEKSLEERQKAAGAGHEESPPRDDPAGEDGVSQVDSEEMPQNAGAIHSPSRRPLDDQGPNDEHENRDNDSLPGNDDDMQVDDMGTERGGGQDMQCPDAGGSSPPSDSNAASDDDDMQVDAMGIDRNGGRHTQHSGVGRTASPSLNNNPMGGRLTRNRSASRHHDEDIADLVNRSVKCRRIVLSPSDDGENLDSNCSTESHEVIDVDLYASLWEPSMVKDLVSIFHSSFSALISLADQAGGTKS